MNKNYIIDIASFFAFVVSAVSGFLLHFMNPKNIIWFARHAWYDIHLWSSIIFIILMLIHIILHFSWMWCMTKNIFACKKRKQRQKNEQPI